MPERDTYERRFDQNARIADIRSFVRKAIAALGGGDDDGFACELATDEAASNAFEHAYAGGNGEVLVTVAREGDEVVISVRNWGAPFDPGQVPAPDLDAPLEERKEGGLGLFLIRRFMNGVSFTFDPVEGNTITMRRRLIRK